MFSKINFHFQATSKQQLSSNWKFHIPDLKVGTLDQLVGLSDDLGKLDNFVEQITRSVIPCFHLTRLKNSVYKT